MCKLLLYDRKLPFGLPIKNVKILLDHMWMKLMHMR